WPQFVLLTFLAIPLSIAGLFVGLLGLVAFLDGAKKLLVLPGVGLVVNLGVLVTVLFWPDLLVPDPRRYASGDADSGPSGVMSGGRGGSSKSEAGDDWVDVSRKFIQSGDVRLLVTSVSIRQGEVKGPRGTLAQGKHVSVRVQLT